MTDAVEQTGSSKDGYRKNLLRLAAQKFRKKSSDRAQDSALIQDSEVSKLIKKCNDFGAGGVSVAIGELADGLLVDLDSTGKNICIIDGTEIAISESQERMGSSRRSERCGRIMSYAKEENLEAVKAE